MRKLQRPPVNLPTLTGTGKRARMAAEYLKAKQADPNARIGKPPDYWTEADVRGALFAFHGRICAYCQRELSRIDPGHVEHFRPKSVYWWLAYSFANYFFSCRVCNCECKAQKFPLAPGATPFSYSDKDRLAEERILLLDPTVDDVEAWFWVDFWDPTCWVAPAPTLDGEPYLRTKTTIAFFRLNEDPELTSERIDVVNRAVLLLAVKDSESTTKVRKMASRFKPHGWAVRLLLAVSNEDTLIPSPAEEIEMFVEEDLLKRLKDAEEKLQAFPQSGLNQRLQEEILWALAVLWKFPPEGCLPELVERLLAKNNCQERVAPYRAQI